MIQIMDSKYEIIVVGGGFVGLTLTGKLLKFKNLRVTILESDQEKLRNLKNGLLGVYEPGLDEIINRAYEKGQLVFSEVLTGHNYHSAFICVGTTHSRKKMNSMDDLVTVSLKIANHITQNGLLFIRSTVRIGTSTNLNNALTTINRADLNVFFAPERTAEGVALQELDTLPQILASNSDSAFDIGKNFLEDLGFLVYKASSYEAAEFTKLVSNAWRDSIFALSNDLAELTQILGLDVYEIINLMNEKYPRAKVAKPGPVGGPCLSKDTHILFESFSENIKQKSVIAVSRTKNESLYSSATTLIADRLHLSNNVTRLLFIGFAFKGYPKTNDVRNSFVSYIVDWILLEELKCEILIWDPSIDKIDFKDYEKFRVDDIDELSPDIIVFGNDGILFDDTNLQNFLNQLTDSSFVIDYWGILNKLRIKRINSFTFGQG
jgi:UDP-N-acetyl-D-mannosaminuronic acid dehydrogenase